MGVAFLATAATGLSRPAPLAAQENLWTWESIRVELTAGVATDLAARGPWMHPTWRQSLPLRLLWANSLNLAYEYVVEPVNAQTNAARWEDAAQRFAGTILGEVVVFAVRRIF